MMRSGISRPLSENRTMRSSTAGSTMTRRPKPTTSAQGITILQTGDSPSRTHGDI